MTSGVELFCAGLRAMGFEPAANPSAPNHIAFSYRVPCGSFEGQEVRLGLHVPGDFPMTPPSGPHVNPIMFHDDGSGLVPRGGVHVNHDATFSQQFGGDWHYWSRPYSGWSTTQKPVSTYMAFVARLWDAL